MGCCQSTAIEEHGNTKRPAAPPVPDACYPDKVGHGGVKVLASSASASSGTSSSQGRTHTRLIVGPNWMFAALFEAHGGGSSPDSAARYCAQQCYAEFQRATEATRPAAAAAGTGSDDGGIRNALAATLKALDRRFLSDDSILAEDRLTSGCTAVLLHISLGETPVATAASLGPCTAVVGQRHGGLASATSQPLVLCGGAASSHGALQDFLAALAAEQRQLASSRAPNKAAAASQKAAARKRKPSPAPSSSNMSQRLVGPVAAAGGLEPAYCGDNAAPQALGFGCAKGMRLAQAGRGASMQEPPEPVMGIGVQTASHILGPSDDCVVLLSGGATAGIAPGDVALLMHRMGRLAAIPFESKPRPLPSDAARSPVVQMDSLGVAGPPPAASPPTPPAAVAPFNAARLLVQHATANAASRGRNAPAAHAAGAMAFALEWPRSSDDSAAAAAASGASVAAVRAAAEAAASSRRRAQYRWQLLRLYYKFPHKRHAAIIDRWHVVFDRVIGKAKAVASQKEMAAWVRLQAAVKVTRGGQVQCLQPRNQHVQNPAVGEQNAAVARTPNAMGGGARQHRSGPGGTPVPNASPLRGTGATRQQSRSPLSAAGAGTNHHGSPAGAAVPAGDGISTNPRSPVSAGGSTRQRSATAGMDSGRQHSPSPAASGTPRSVSARESGASTAAAAAGSAETPTSPAGPSPARQASLPASPARKGPVGLLEAEGIVLQDTSRNELRSAGSATDSRRLREPSASPSLADPRSHMPMAAVGAATAAEPTTTATIVSVSPKPSAVEPPVEADGSKQCSRRSAGGATGPGDGADGHADPSLSACAATVLSVTDNTAATPAVGHIPSVRNASQAATDGAAGKGAGPSAIIPKPADATTVNTITAATSPTSPRAAPTTRIPSLSAGGAPISSLAGCGDAAAVGQSTSRARAEQATPRSAIPTLQLQPGPAAAAAAAAAIATPRLSMPGGIPAFQRTPPSVSAGGAAATPGPATRANNSWGGGGATPTNINTAAPNSARSGSSRLPRPANLSATTLARSGGGGSGAAPSATAAGSNVITRSLFAGSDAGSAAKPAASRPPLLDVTFSVVGARAGAVTAPGGACDDADLFSPDSAQLEAWAAEAVNAISASATKKQQLQTPPAQQAKAPLSQRQGPGSSGGRGTAAAPAGSWKSMSLGRTGLTASAGGALPGQGSRIPLSPRHPNSAANNSNTPSRTPSSGSVSKTQRATSSGSMGGMGGGRSGAASADLSSTTPQRTASARTGC